MTARVNTHLRIQRLLHRQLQAVPPDAPLGRPDDDATGAHVVEARAPGTPVFRTGDIVAFRFRIVRYLAKGGMGELYEAEDLELRERIALKTILSDIAADERSIALFKREVHLARQVTHPNVCRIYDVFRHRSSAAGDRSLARSWCLRWSCCTAMLADKLRRDGRLSLPEILPVVRQAAGDWPASACSASVSALQQPRSRVAASVARRGHARRGDALAWRGSEHADDIPSMSLSAENEISGTPGAGPWNRSRAVRLCPPRMSTRSASCFTRW